MAERPGQPQHAPATPVYILRGHAAPIHALDIFSRNLRLVSGDAEGWIVVWDLVTKRPVTVWKAHEGAVLEVKGFCIGNGGSEIYTHGRDHKLCVWKIRVEDEGFLDKTLPVDYSTGRGSAQTGSQPWLVHSLPVNALNFCAFAMTFIDAIRSSSTGDAQETSNPDKILLAVPNALDSGGIDIFHLPSERRITTIPSDPSIQTGMVMAVNIFLSPPGDVYVVSAFEDGHVMVSMHRGPLTAAEMEPGNAASSSWRWEKLYISRPHTQPVLSIDVSPARDYFLSSSADALIIKHPIPSPDSDGGMPVVNRKEDLPLKTTNTKHSGQQGLRMRRDGKIYATAGWDSRIRVYSGKTMKELAVLKWHQEGCYSVAFGEVAPSCESLSPDGPESETNPRQITHSQSLSLAAIRRQRDQKIQQTHWLAAGSKDGKISLWDIY
ncbi:uncharacterized protein N7459_002974 [Penicillium hispanicum]|uniref:uncharacterized protein n=1 Tax=Penicillium hispanicum TaxID=1080232 RepID=UPI00253FFC3F|nr:uncharacterized protein N7459_002974 [Penicillium hispanicum]KAJ5587209.1 hypothetical protein N7459_002974 [Penicillium hispanicum]